MAKQKVLIVDDEPGIRTLLELMVQDAGCEVVSAGTPFEALRLTEEHRPSMAILDYSLPQMTGVELGIRLRERYGDDFPLLFMSVLDIPRRELARVKSYLYMSKPFDLENLLQAIDSALAPVRPLPFGESAPADQRLAG